jgi:hypothetical protein
MGFGDHGGCAWFSGAILTAFGGSASVLVCCDYFGALCFSDFEEALLASAGGASVFVSFFTRPAAVTEVRDTGP